MKRVKIKATLVALMLVALPGMAYGEAGEGLKAGAFTLQPGISLGSKYSTNLYRQNHKDVKDLTRVPKIQISPFFNVATDGDALLQLSLNASVTWDQVIGDELVRKQSGLSSLVQGEVAFNRQGAWSLSLNNRFSRTLTAPSTKVDYHFVRTENDVGAELGVHPGGKALQGYLGYHFVRLWVDPIKDLQRMVHIGTFRGQWLFLPRTSAVFLASLEYYDYDQELRPGEASVATGGNGGDIRTEDAFYRHENSMPLRLQLGANGLITKRLGFRAFVGYGNSFHRTKSFNSVIADAQLFWKFGNLAEGNIIRLGYERNFTETVLGQYYSYNQPYFSYHQRFFDQRLSIDTKLTAHFRSFEGIPSVQRLELPPEMNDILLTGTASLSFSIFRWWSLRGTYQFIGNFSKDELRHVETGDVQLRSFREHVVTLTTTFKY